MTDRQSAAPDRLHSLPRYRQPLPRENATRHIVVLQSAAACSAFVGGLEQPLVLNGESTDFAWRLHQVLVSVTIGSQLYIMGDEAFIWRIHGEARNAGLEVREHFSKRLGAYLGVCTNPDQPYSGTRS